VVNDPVYLGEFVEHAAASGLRYLADTSVPDEPPFVGRSGGIPRTPDDVAVQQRTDIIRGRKFRSAVLCREDEPRSDSINFDEVGHMHVTSRMEADHGDPNGQTFSVSGDEGTHTLTIREPAVAMALAILGQIFPRSMRIDQLITTVAERRNKLGHSEDFSGALVSALLELSSNLPFSRPAVEMLVESFPFVSTVSEQPNVSAAARYFLGHGPIAMTRRHETGRVDDIARFALQQLDGSRTVDDVAALVLAENVAGRLPTPSGVLENAENDDERHRQSIRIVEQVIDSAVKNAVLVG
jgi:methyltransferase-like protein